MSTGIFLRALVVQLIAVAALSAVLGLALPHGFFEDWGWLVGPAGPRLPVAPEGPVCASSASPEPIPALSTQTPSRIAMKCFWGSETIEGSRIMSAGSEQ
jgi:hypothetical protein